MSTAPPSAAIKPAALNPVSFAIAVACAWLLFDENLVLVDLAVTSVALAGSLVDVTGQEVVHGIALVNGKLLTKLAEAKTGA